MDLNYLPFDFATRTNINRRETEREYFMRLIREQQAARAMARRQARVRKIKSLLQKTFARLQPKRTEHDHSQCETEDEDTKVQAPTYDPAKHV